MSPYNLSYMHDTKNKLGPNMDKSEANENRPRSITPKFGQCLQILSNYLGPFSGLLYLIRGSSEPIKNVNEFENLKQDFIYNQQFLCSYLKQVRQISPNFIV